MSITYLAFPIVERHEDAPCQACPDLQPAKQFAQKESRQRAIVYQVWQISPGPLVRLITVFRNGEEVSGGT
jgi:hypothetical protein